jgi:hypothetical protein
LPENEQLVTTGDDDTPLNMPPPIRAVFPLNMQRVTAGEAFSLCIPPPALPTKTQPVIAGEESMFAIPPPPS